MDYEPRRTFKRERKSLLITLEFETENGTWPVQTNVFVMKIVRINFSEV